MQRHKSQRHVNAAKARWRAAEARAQAERDAGIPLHTIGQVLGHRDARSTQRYSHLTTDTLAAAVGMIGKKKRA